MHDLESGGASDPVSDAATVEARIEPGGLRNELGTRVKLRDQQERGERTDDQRHLLPAEEPVGIAHHADAEEAEEEVRAEDLQ